MGGKAINPVMAKAFMVKAGVTPLEPFISRKSPWKSKCQSCGRVVSPTYGNVINGHSACRFCAKGGVTVREAETLLRELKAKPLVSYPGYKIPWLSQCLICNREISPRLSHISKTRKACNYCNRRKVDSSDANKIAIKAGAIPLEPYPGPGRWTCKCKVCKRTIFPTLRRMRNGQNPCGWCARVRIDPLEAKQAFIDAGLNPIGKYPGAGTPWNAICENCGERVSRKLSSIQAGRYACGYCSGRKLKESKAKALMREAGAIPLEPFKGINEKWQCKCSVCFREISPKLGNVRAGHSPCVYCSGKKVDAKTAYEYALSKGLRPLTKYPGATQRWKVHCLRCNRKSTVSWVTLQMKRKNAGCSSCTEYGFKPLEPTYLYVITHPTKLAHKVGIGNTSAKRIEQHLKNGWEIYKILEFKKGVAAHRVEQDVIEWLRTEKSLGPAFRMGDGWTETVPSSEISLATIARKVGALSGANGKTVNVAKFVR